MQKVKAQELSRTEKFAPFGMDNPKPAFLLREIKVSNISWFGKGEEHLRLALVRDDGFEEKPLEAIAFFARRDLGPALKTLPNRTHITMLGHLERDTFTRGQPVRLRIIALAP
jgi:single-stranded-DNA-specific exonuclease